MCGSKIGAVGTWGDARASLLERLREVTEATAWAAGSLAWFSASAAASQCDLGQLT